MPRRTFHGTTAAMSLYQTAIATTPLQKAGIPLGFHAKTNQPIYLQPYSLSDRSNVYSIEGERGMGKSLFMKTLGCRLPILQVRDRNGQLTPFRQRFSSRKSEQGFSEYDPILRAMHTQAYSLAGGNSINLFGLLKYEPEVVVMALHISSFLSNGPLSAAVRVRIIAGVRKMFRIAPNKPHPVLLENTIRHLEPSDLQEFHRTNGFALRSLLAEEISGNPSVLNALHITDEELNEQSPERLGNETFLRRHNEAKEEAADLWLSLIEGYNRVFRGEDSLYDVLSQDVVGLDWENLAEGAAEIIESVLMRAEASAITYGRSSSGLDLSRIIPHADYSDEEGSAMKGFMHTDSKRHKFNTLRAYPTAIFESKQYYVQGYKAGEAGSAHREAAQEVEFSITARILFRQPNDANFLQRFSELGMSDEYVDMLTKLERGQAVLFVRDRTPMPFNHFVLPSEEPLIRTTGANEQMNSAVPLVSQEEWQRRHKVMKSLTIGNDQTDHG